MSRQVVVADAVEAEAWEDLYAAAPSSMGLATHRIGGALVLRAKAVPMAMFNRAIGFGNAGEPTEADLDAILASFGDARAIFVHVHDETRERARVEAWLRERGLKLGSRATWTKFVRGAEPPPEATTSLEVREVGGEHASALARALVAAHEMPPPMQPWLEALVGRPRWRTYALFDGDEVVGGGCSFRASDGVWLGMAGTVASHRGRGGQKAVMARRVADAIVSGAPVVVTETGTPAGEEPSPSYQNMLWCGFEPVALRANWTR